MRTILDADLKSWEAYATPGEFGGPAPAKIAFRCTSDAGERPRVFLFQGDKSEAEKFVVECHQGELVKMLLSAESVA